MVIFRILLATWLLFSVGACSQATLVRPTTHGASLVLTPRFAEHAFGAQATVGQVTRADIQHLVLKLYTWDGVTETPLVGAYGSPLLLDLVREELDAPITIANLRGATTYRVRAYAYKAAGTSASDLISTTDADSCTDIVMSSQDAPTLSTFRVKLLPTSFGASARITVSTTDSTRFSSVTYSLYGPLTVSSPFVASASVKLADLPNRLTFANLQAHSTYRLEAQAVDATGAAIANATGSINIIVGDDTDVPAASLVLSIPN